MLQRAVMLAAESLRVLETHLIDSSQKQDIRVSSSIYSLYSANVCNCHLFVFTLPHFFLPFFLGGISTSSGGL